MRWRWPSVGAGARVFTARANAPVAYEVLRFDGEVRLRCDEMEPAPSVTARAPGWERSLSADATGAPVIAAIDASPTLVVAFPTLDGYRVITIGPGNRDESADVTLPPEVGHVHAVQLQAFTNGSVAVYIRANNRDIVDTISAALEPTSRTVLDPALRSVDGAWPDDLTESRPLSHRWRLGGAEYRLHRRSGAVVMSKRVAEASPWTTTLVEPVSAAPFDEAALLVPHGDDVVVVLHGRRYAFAELVDGATGEVTSLGPTWGLDHEGVRNVRLQIFGRLEAGQLVVYGRGASGSFRASRRLGAYGAANDQGTLTELRWAPRPLDAWAARSKTTDARSGCR